MDYAVRFTVNEKYGLDTYVSYVEEKLEGIENIELMSKNELIVLAYDQYISRIEDGYLPLMPDDLDESDWTLKNYSLTYYNGMKLKHGNDAIIDLSYKNISPRLWD